MEIEDITTDTLLFEAHSGQATGGKQDMHKKAASGSLLLTGTSKERGAYYLGKKKVPLDINSCDSASLEALPGIGPVLSARIIKYRKLLGGFTRVEQIKEVYGLTEETYELISGRIYIDTAFVKRININSAGFKELIRIPYLEKYDVTAILRYRELKGRITGTGDLVENKILTKEKAEKSGPYLKFE